LLGTISIIIEEKRNTAKSDNKITKKNGNTTKNNSGTMNYMEPKHQNNRFIDRKQCSLASSRGTLLAEQRSITIIL
jgi:hypothetical protein